MFYCNHVFFFTELFSETNAVAIVFPTAISVSVVASHRGRLAGLEVNIGTSGMLPLVAVPTNCKKLSD